MAPAFATGGDDPGNNGTVKIAGKDIDRIPNNAPHQGCTFDIEWYGFDETAKSEVTFALQKPTAGDGYDLEVDGESPVDVGGDGGSGAGTDDGFDARETYTLTLTGDPHPKQGYHVKLTINTTYSQGADTKHKVFWVQGCEANEPNEEPTPIPTPSESVPTEEPSEEPSEEPTEAPTEEPTESTPGTDETEPADEESSEAPVADSEVPTNIDAGLAGESDSAVPAMWPLLAMLAGAAAAGTALVVVLRRRAAALVHKD